jgi:hypothetical protein
MADSDERGNEASSSMKSCQFVEWLSNCWLLKKDSAQWRELVNIKLKMFPTLCRTAVQYVTSGT